MELTPKQQTIDLIVRAERLLILTHKHPDGDALGSVLALKMALEKLSKKVVAACPSQLPTMFQFLPQRESILQSLPTTDDIIITVDTRDLTLEKLGYRSDEQKQQLHIVITPKHGTITKDHLSVSRSTPTFDAIIVLDTPDVDRLAELYDTQPKLFYETPVINIDHHPSNEQFGRINWIDMVATSTAEILVALLESLAAKTMIGGQPPNLLGEDVATCLLTGIIADTSSFQNVNTTPKSLTVAAQLVAAGARQQEIIYHLYKTKPLSTLKLWGAVLARVTDEQADRFVWTLALEDDFTQAGAQENELAGLIDELLKTIRDRNFVIIFSERGRQLHGSVRAINQAIDVSALAGLFHGGGHPQAAAFDLPIQSSVDETVDEAITAIKNWATSKRFTTNLPSSKV